MKAFKISLMLILSLACILVYAGPARAGTTTIHIDTEPGGIIGEASAPVNSNGAMFWNNVDQWVANNTCAHLYFTSLVTGERIKTHSVTNIEGSSEGQVISQDGFSATRSIYTYEAADSSGGIFSYEAVQYNITVPGTVENPEGWRVILRSRGTGNGTGQAYFDIYIQNPNGTIEAMRADPVWFSYTGLSLEGAMAQTSASDSKVYDLPSLNADYYMDIEGGSDMGGMTFQFHSGALINILTPNLGSSFPISFSCEYTSPSGNIIDLLFTPTLISESHSGSATTFILSNEQGGLIDKLIAADHGDKNLYEVLELLQPQSGGVISDEFLQTLQSCPANSEVFDPDASLSNFAGLNNPVGINSDGTLMILSIYGKDYVGHPGYPTEKGFSADAGEMWFTHAQDQGFYIDTGHAVAGAGSGNYKAFAIAWQPYLVPTFVLSNEEGGLIDQLIAAGYGDDSLYELLQVLKPLSGGAITDEFMAQLADCPAGCDAKTAALNNFADVNNNPIGIGANGELIVSACYGRDFYGDAGYTTNQCYDNAAGYMLFTSADSGSYYIDLGCKSDGNNTYYYKGFAIAWSPNIATTFVLSNEEGGLIKQLIDMGYGTSNLYQVLATLGPASGGVISEEFLETLASCPTDSEIFTATLNDCLHPVNNPIGINSDGTLIVVPIYGRDYCSRTGYATYPDSADASGNQLFTYATDPAYYIDAGSNGSGGSYKVFAIAWSAKSTSPSSGGGGGGGSISLPTVATGSATSSTGSSAVLNGEITARGGASISAYGFMYKPEGGEWTQVKAGTNDLLGSFSYSLSSLSPNTEYYFKAYATNSRGTAYGQEKSFLVLEEQKVKAPGSMVIRFYIDKNQYYVNDQEKTMDTVPIIVEERTLLPIRYVAENLGAVVSWDAEARKATIALNDQTIELWIGQGIAKVNRVDMPIDPDNPAVVPIIQEPGRAMLPLRFIAETMGCTVTWNPDIQEIKVTYPKV